MNQDNFIAHSSNSSRAQSLQMLEQTSTWEIFTIRILALRLSNYQIYSGKARQVFLKFLIRYLNCGYRLLETSMLALDMQHKLLKVIKYFLLNHKVSFLDCSQE